MEVQSQLVEVSLLFRAMVLAIFFFMLGVLPFIHRNENVPRFIYPLCVVSILVGLANAVIAVEWLYFFFIKE